MERTDPNHPLARLRHHVTGAVERGEAQPIVARTRCPTCRISVLPGSHNTTGHCTGCARHLQLDWVRP